MRRLLLLLGLLCISFFIVDRGGGMIMGRLMQNPNDPFLLKLNHVVDDLDEDIVLFGTSRILYGINPSILEDSTGMTAFNCGISGGKNIYTHYILLNYLLSHHIPRVIILEIGKDDFSKEVDPFALNKLYHFYGKNDICDSLLIELTGDKGLKFSHLYRYNLIAKKLLFGLVRSKKEMIKNGYEPLLNKRKGEFGEPKKIFYDRSRMDYNKLDICKQFIEKCIKNGVQLVLVTLPNYKSIIDKEYYSPVKSYAEKYQIPFLDYHHSTGFYKHIEYFADRTHLKIEGAEVLSALLAHDLREILQDTINPQR